MTDSTDIRRVKEIQAFAKNLGFTIDPSSGSIYLRAATKGFPNAMFGKTRRVYNAYTLEEIRGYLFGFQAFQDALTDIEFDLDEYKKRVEEQKVLDILRGEE